MLPWKRNKSSDGYVVETAASPQRLREGIGGAVFPFPQDAIEAVALQQLRHRLVAHGHEQARKYLT